VCPINQGRTFHERPPALARSTRIKNGPPGESLHQTSLECRFLRTKATSGGSPSERAGCSGVSRARINRRSPAADR
jgi:hypothetical protein